ncbi:hypothetical protein GCM10023067_16630 [Aminobacter aganoensis]
MVQAVEQVGRRVDERAVEVENNDRFGHGAAFMGFFVARADSPGPGVTQATGHKAFDPTGKNARSQA